MAVVTVSCRVLAHEFALTHTHIVKHEACIDKNSCEFIGLIDVQDRHSPARIKVNYSKILSLEKWLVN